jgi:phosphate uptake regulator
MVFDFFKRGGGSTIEEVEATLVRMLRDGRTVYDASMAAVFGGGASKATRREVRGTDHDINEGQRQVRRALLLHVSVSPSPDLPLVLAYMSVVKDVERVGDYAKSLYDIARWGADFSAAPDRADLEHQRDTVGALLDEAAAVFENRDVARAQELVLQADTYLDAYDDQMRESAQSDGVALDAVTRALFSFYLGRITAHVMNLMTSLVLPVDQLDYYDEARDDRTDP